MFYCSATHQKVGWKSGHKQRCSIQNECPNQVQSTSTILFPEFELTLEAEDDVDSIDETDEQAETRRMKEYQELIKSGKVGNMPDVSEADLLPYAQGDGDVAFNKFKKRISLNNNQVLRYNRGGEPLWISSKNTLENQLVPRCELCQSKRIFEFQVRFFSLHANRSQNV